MMFVFVDPAFSSMFDGTFEEIHFKAPSLVSGRLFGLIVSALMESFSPEFMFGFLFVWFFPATVEREQLPAAAVFG